MTGKFVVLLGGDGSGKSTALSKIHLPGWSVVSYSASHVPVDYLVVRELASVVRSKAVPMFTRYDDRFRTAMYHLFVTYLADVVEKQLQVSNVICDSYYYKFLAKELVLKTGDTTIHNSWRNYRQPDLLMNLDVSPELAYQRIIAERPLQLNERFAAETDELNSFVTFQQAINKKCRVECSRLQWVTINGEHDPSSVASEIITQLNAAEESGRKW